jgi:acetyl-CoA C-acetyltransferase
MPMKMDERTPVIVGVAQVEQREDDPAVAREPLALMLEAVRAAATDCGNPSILAEVDSVRVVRGMWGYGNPARVLAQQIGVPSAETGLTSLGGNYVQSLTNRSFLDIQSGLREVVVVTGGECGRTQARASKAGIELDWNPLATAPGTSPVARDNADPAELYLGSDKVTRHEAELKRGIEKPVRDRVASRQRRVCCCAP